MNSLFNDMKRKADEVTLEADKKIRVTRKQGEINDVRKQIRQRVTELGDVAYGLHAQGQPLPTPLTNIGSAIDDLYTAIKAKEAEIEAIRREQLPPVDIPQTTNCQTCHQPLPPNAAFCLHCGGAVAQPEPMVPCPHCQSLVPAEARFCAHCGKSIALQQAPDTISCSNCAAVLPTTALFCPECGTSVEQTPEPIPAPVDSPIIDIDSVRCQKCGTELHTDAIFCPECGTPVVVEAVVEAETVVLPAPDPSEVTDSPDDVDDSSTDSADIKHCPVCAAEVPDDAEFCEICGAAIDGAIPDMT